MFVPLLFVRLSVCVSAKITRKAVIGFDEIFLDGWGMAERFWWRSGSQSRIRDPDDDPDPGFFKGFLYLLLRFL